MTEKLDAIFAGYKDILFAYWYGSMNENSDIDVAIYLTPDSSLAESGKDYLSLYDRLENCLEKTVDLFILNTVPIELAYSMH
ncbi:unnamed protein product, partial [marine sediment metagenome]